MPSSTLVIEVRFHDARYHGREWPPSPARLFQALIAGAYGGRHVTKQRDEKDAAFAWLESLPPPVIAAPICRKARGVGVYVPNNDLDTVGGDPARIGEIRGARKTFAPWLIEPPSSLLYLWPFSDGEPHARLIVALAEQLHTLGWGIDAAFAKGEILSGEEAEQRLANHGGTVHRPARSTATGSTLACPAQGTLASLHQRFDENRTRFLTRSVGGRKKKTTTEFRKPSHAHFRQVGYDCPPTRLLFDIVPADGGTRRPREPQPLINAARIVERVRNVVAARLAPHYPSGQIERLVIGRGAGDADKAQRLRLIPLPSIGADHADHAIRRLLVEIPPDCPLPVRDLEWALAGAALGDDGIDAETGEINEGPRLAMAADDRMLKQFAIDDEACTWRSVTPVILPRVAGRGRRNGTERLNDERAKAVALEQSLRHVGIDPRGATFRLQREPFHARGARACDFYLPDHLKGRLAIHVELTLARPTFGPLILGDGRFVGLGLMQPIIQHADAFVLEIAEECRPGREHRSALLRAVRRALMSLAKDEQGKVELLFSGHEPDCNAPARSGVHEHIYLAADDTDGDGRLDRILVVAPWRVDAKCTIDKRRQRRFSAVVSKLSVVRAGELGCLQVSRPSPPRADDPAFRLAHAWKTCVPLRPDRHPKSGDLNAEIARDVAARCQERGQPRPHVEITERIEGPRGGLNVHARLIFPVAVPGPILLGRDAHSGGGLCIAEH